LKIAFMLLHDFRFAGWSLGDFFRRSHFSKEYSRRLAERGHEVILYMLHQEVESLKEFERDGYRVKVFPVQFDFPPFLKFGNSHSLKITRELSQDEPDIVHFNNYYLWSFPYVAKWAMQNSVRIVCQYHGAGDILQSAKRAFIPILQGVDRYLVAKDSEIEYLTGGLGVPRQKVLKFPNVGVDPSVFRPSGERTREPSLIYVGRMSPMVQNLGEKSPWLVLDTMAVLLKSLPEATLHMVGDGPCLQCLRKVAEAKGIGRSVTFHGYVANDLVPPFYSRSWATFIPLQLDAIDPYWEGSLKESLACATPVVGFNQGVKDYGGGCQRLGHLIPPDPAAGGKMLCEILGARARLDEAGRRGRAEVLRCCTWDLVIGGLEKVYSSLAQP